MERRNTSLEDELREALVLAGHDVSHIRGRPIPRDGVERRGAIRDVVDVVKNLLVFSGDELDEDSARVLLNWILVWIRARRDAGEDDDVEFVSIYGQDGRSVLLNVRVPRQPDHYTV